MSEQVPTASKPRRRALGAFVVEANTRANGDAVVRCGSDCQSRRLRGKWTRYGLGALEQQISEGMSTITKDIPGMRIRVNPSKNTIVIFDPLEKDVEQLQALQSALRADRAIGSTQTITAVPTKTIQYDDDHFKTFMHHLLNGVGRTLELHDGELPTAEQVDELPGRLLHDVANRTHRKPKYKDQVPAWDAFLESAHLRPDANT